MIDTEKYEKVLQTPCEYNVSYRSSMQIEELQICGYKLLAEVKQLREEINTLNEIIDTDRKRVYDVAQKLLEAIE
tara:strand:+ start:4815 stop:5039 length:225 start_codon:yes stop_codon:yes gene_type:complete